MFFVFQSYLAAFATSGEKTVAAVMSPKNDTVSHISKTQKTYFQVYTCILMGCYSYPRLAVSTYSVLTQGGGTLTPPLSTTWTLMEESQTE